MIAGWSAEYRAALRKTLRDAQAEHERRVAELREANNREVERRRLAVSALRVALARVERATVGERWLMGEGFPDPEMRFVDFLRAEMARLEGDG